jgi:hypothetical protein
MSNKKEKEQRQKLKTSCPKCGANNYYLANEMHYVYHVCKVCKKPYFISPRRADMKIKLGSRPDERYFLTKDDLLEMIDIALDIKDLDMAREYRQMIDYLEDKEVLIFDVHDDTREGKIG